MGKTIAIVGAGEGIGLAVAERFGREGFNVALPARSSTTCASSTGMSQPMASMRASSP